MLISCTTLNDIARTFPVMRQLRPEWTEEGAYTAAVQTLCTEHGFRLLAWIENSQCLGCAGYTIENRLYKGKVLYLADLVVLEEARSMGIGAKILAGLREIGRAESCTHLLLDSGVQRTGAHRFYFREGFHIACYNFSQAL